MFPLCAHRRPIYHRHHAICGRTTPGLRALRRSFAAAALLEDRLRLDPSDGRLDRRTDEARILQDLWRLPAAVLGALWRREADPERTRASADWVHGNIVVDRL